MVYGTTGGMMFTKTTPLDLFKNDTVDTLVFLPNTLELIWVSNIDVDYAEGVLDVLTEEEEPPDSAYESVKLEFEFGINDEGLMTTEIELEPDAEIYIMSEAPLNADEKKDYISYLISEFCSKHKDLVEDLFIEIDKLKEASNVEKN